MGPPTDGPDGRGEPRPYHGTDGAAQVRALQDGTDGRGEPRPYHGTDGAAPFGCAQGRQVRALQPDHS